MKKGYTLIEVMIVVIIVAIVLGIGGCVAGVCIVGCHAKKAIDEKGIKGIATQVWEGTNSQKVSEKVDFSDVTR